MAFETSFLNAKPAALSAYVLRATESGATVTLKGFFVDANGAKCGAVSYSGSIDTTPRLLVGGASDSERVFAGVTALPDAAVGFIGRLSGDAIFSLHGAATGADSTDMSSNPGNYPVLPTNRTILLGRVG